MKWKFSLWADSKLKCSVKLLLKNGKNFWHGLGTAYQNGLCPELKIIPYKGQKTTFKRFREHPACPFSRSGMYRIIQFYKNAFTRFPHYYIFCIILLIFCVWLHYNRENYPFLTLFNVQFIFPRFSENPFTLTH